MSGVYCHTRHVFCRVEYSVTQTTEQARACVYVWGGGGAGASTRGAPWPQVFNGFAAQQEPETEAEATAAQSREG